MNQAIRRIRDGLAKQNLTMRKWALREGYSRQAVSITLKRWAGRDKTPHGGIAREIMTRLEKTLADPEDESAPAMCTVTQSDRLALVRRFLAGDRSRSHAEALAAEAGVHISTFYRWLAEARAQGAAAVPVVVDGDRVKVQFPPSRVPVDTLSAVVGWLLTDTRRTLKEGHQRLAGRLAEPISYVQFTRLVRDMVPSFEDLKRYRTAGPVPLRLGQTPKILRRWSDLPAGHTYVGDQHLLDYQCVLPETGEVVNLQLYVWMDAATTYWTGMVASYGPYTQYTVGLALLDACRLHVPTVLLNDNGRQEKSAYVDGLWARLAPHVDLDGSRHYTTPNLPPVKPIEAQMSVLTKFLNQRELPGYRKRDADPFRNKERQGALAQTKKAGDLPTVEALLAALVQVMERHNTTPTRSEVDGDTYIPAERFHQQLAGRRIVLPEADLKGLFYPRFQRKVRNACVRVKIGGKVLEFTHPDLAHAAPDEDVQVLINPLPPHSGGLALRFHPSPSGRGDGGEGRWEPWCALEPWHGRGVAPYADPDTLEALMRQKQSYLNQFRDALDHLHAAARARFAPDKPGQPTAPVIRLTDGARLRDALAEPESLASAANEAIPASGGRQPTVSEFPGSLESRNRGLTSPARPPEGEDKPLVIDHQAALRALEEYRRKRAAES